MLARLAQAQKEYDDPAPLFVASPKPASWSPPSKSEKK
jgi:hypothetical protein